jgi:hypothetical protein
VRTQNNRVLIVRNPITKKIEARYVVSDLGATLGRDAGLGGGRSKNNLDDFLSTRFVTGVEEGVVKFDFDARPTGLGVLTVFYPPYYKSQLDKETTMRGIPVRHARWVGMLLARLSDRQLRDAFRAAGYDRETTNGYVRALRSRIKELVVLRSGGRD